MRILIVSNVISLYTGGHARNIFLLGKELVNIGHDVTFFVYKTIGDGIYDQGIPIIKSKLKKYNLPFFSREIAKYIVNNSFDIIHSNGSMNYFYFNSINKIPTVFHARSHNFINGISILRDPVTYKSLLFKNALGAFYEYFFDLKYISKKSYVFANCNDVRNKLLEDPFCKINKISVIRNAVEIRVVKSQKNVFLNKYSFGYLANFYPLKGFDYLLKIIFETVKLNRDVQFHIGGDGIFFKSFQMQLKKMGIDKNVKLYGRLKSKIDRDSFFNSFKYYIVPSHCPTTVTEALSYNKYIFHFGRSIDCAHGMDLEPFIKINMAERHINLEPYKAAKRLVENEIKITIIKKEENKKLLEKYYSWKTIALKCIENYSNIISSANND